MSHYGNYKPDFWQAQNKPNTGRFVSWMSKVSSQPKKIALAALFALIFGFIICMAGCKTTTPTVIEKEKIVYVHSDSVRYIDSTIVIPIEVYKDYTGLLDTLYLKTSISESWSAVDTNKMLLVGELKNTKAIQYKYIEVEKIVKNDSIVEVEKPVPYPVVEEKKVIPTFAWICIIWSILSIVLLGVWAYLKFSKPI